MTADTDFEVELDRRITVCKTKHPEWLEYNEKSAISASKQDDTAYKLEKTRFLCKHLSTGLFASDDLIKNNLLLYIGEDNTVKVLYQKETMCDSMAWLLNQKNVRRIYAIGSRGSWVVHTDGTVSHFVTYSDTETRAAIKYAKTLADKMRSMDGWKDISDISIGFDDIVALTANGSLNIVRTDFGPYATDNTRWADSASDAAVLGRDSDKTFNHFYISSKGVLYPSEGPRASWLNFANKVYRGSGIFVVGKDYAACLDEEGELNLSYNADSIDLSVQGWPKLAHILGWGKTFVGLTRNGVVYATGEKSHLFNGWSNIAFLTRTDYTVFGIRWDGSCVCTDQNVDLSKADFSWLIDKDFNLQKWVGKI